MVVKTPPAMTDCEFLIHMLGDGQPRSLNQLLRASFQLRGCGMTVHSRAADLRRKGYTVLNWNDKERGHRGDSSMYQLIEASSETVT